MKKTLLCHFYNEEWLLPFWLKHHRQIFDHGIMINFNSTDRSVEIIREICPTWEIHQSSNTTFQNPSSIDREVLNYEAPLEGWRICLNVPEFLIGNYNRLENTATNVRHYIGQYMFVDMEHQGEPELLDVNQPIYEQRHWGYGIVTEFNGFQSHGSAKRPPRSIHNYAAPYPTVGRHFWKEKHSFEDLVIFYYGFGSIEENSLKRRLQIQTKFSTPPKGTAPGSHHVFTKEQLLEKFRLEQQLLSRDLTAEIKPIIDLHKQWVDNKQ
jgi:hypothetical protein